MIERVLTSARRAMESGEAYRRRFGGRAPERIEDIPFTYPGELSADPLAFVTAPARELARAAFTSGSSGAPKRIYFTEGDLERTREYFRREIIPMIGSGGRRCVIMLPGGDRPDGVARLLAEAVTRLGVEPLVWGRPRSADEAADAIAPGDVIVGAPADVAAICRPHPGLRPESVLLSSDYTPPPIAGSVRELWGCRVYEHYGLTETCYGCAVQREPGGVMFVREESVFMEVIDGEIVVSAFGNEAMPIFRYRTGDEGELAPGEPQALARASGRIGGAIARLDDELYAMRDLWSYRAERGESGITITASGAPSINADEIAARAAAALGGERVRVSIAGATLSYEGKRKIISV